MKKFEIRPKRRELRFNITQYWSIAIALQRVSKNGSKCKAFYIAQMNYWKGIDEDDDYEKSWIICLLNFAFSLTKWKKPIDE